jgi:hypothetical protein
VWTGAQSWRLQGRSDAIAAFAQPHDARAVRHRAGKAQQEKQVSIEDMRGIAVGPVQHISAASKSTDLAVILTGAIRTAQNPAWPHMKHGTVPTNEFL